MIDISKTAELAMLSFSDDEAQGLKNDLEQIVEWVNKIDELKPDSIAPTYTISENSNVFRDSQSENNYSRDEMLRNAAVHTDEYISVPRLIGKE